MESMEQRLEMAKVERWRALAEKATPVYQLATTFPGKRESSALVAESGRLIARSMRFVDGAFHAEARLAVLQLAKEVELLRLYAEYVQGTVELASILMQSGAQQSFLPLSYEDWLATRQEGHEQ